MSTNEVVTVETPRQWGADPRLNRREALRAVLALSASAISFASFAQSRPGKVARVGILQGQLRAFNSALLQLSEALRELGWIEGQNIVYEWRFAEGQYAELPRLAVELVQLRPDVIVVLTNPEAEAALQATRTIPIVISAALDPVAAGLAQSLAHPGGSVTGLLWGEPALAGKIVQVLHEAVPTMRRLALLYDESIPSLQPYVAAQQSAATAIRLELRRFPVRRAEEVASALSSMETEHMDGISVIQVGAVAPEIPLVLDFAAKRRLPTAFAIKGPVERGGFLAYSQSYSNAIHRSAALVDKILKGAKPADVPFEQPIQYELVINLKTANALGIKLPQSVLLRADRLIE